uniref:Venom s1 protease with cub domain 17 n=1 Tax=Pristhesancus plagipennis TaxID=1955184 RepID=A0A1Q1NPI7_PRIPG|nr:venom s1 protease with cub domain 17 [Pristhesancus plagipennis]
MLRLILFVLVVFIQNSICDEAEHNLYLGTDPLTIQSPNYPEYAPENYSAKWRVYTELKANILIKCDISLMQSDGCKDAYLIVYNGETPQKYCGKHSNVKIISKSNQISLKLQAGGSKGKFQCRLIQDKDEEVTLRVGNPPVRIAFIKFQSNWKKSWKFVTDRSNSRVSFLCNNFVMGLEQGGMECGNERMVLETDRGLEMYCGSLENITVASGSLRLSLKTGVQPFGSINCIVQAVTGESLLQYRNIDSEEVDSREMIAGQSGALRETTCNCGTANKGLKKVVNKEQAEQNEYPWIAALLVNGEHACAGSIITEYHVLTAAQCTSDVHEKNVQVAVGSNNNKALIARALGQVINVRTIVAHQFDAKHYHRNDIAVLLLRKKIEFNKSVMPICLPNSPVDLTNQYVTVTGWDLNVKGKHPEILKKKKLRVIDINSCSFVYSNIFNTNNPEKLCTFSKDTAFCKGDLGAPLIWLDPETGKYTQVGIVSYSNLCNGKVPTLSTNVNYYYKWIQQAIEDTKSDLKTCSKI